MRWLVTALAILLALLALAAAGAGWLIGTESGLQWAASKVPGLSAEGLRGRLAGEMHADSVAYAADGLRISAKNLSVRTHLAALLGGRLTLDPVSAATIEVALSPSPQPQQAQREPFQLPIRVHVGNATIDAIEVRRGDARSVVKEVRVEHARLGPEVSLAGSAYWPHERFATRAELELRGTLERIEARATGEVAGIKAQARAVVTPGSVQAIEARAGPIDLAQFDGPRTALEALLKADMTSGGALAGSVLLENAAPGTIDAGRVPATRLETRFLTDFASARLSGLRATLEGGATLQGEATLEPGALEAKLAAAAVDLRALHSRLRRTALHGPLQVAVSGKRQWARGSLTQEGIGLTVQLERAGDVVEVQELAALVEGGAVSGTGSVTLSEAMPFSANLKVTRFDPSAIGDYPAGSLSGSVLARGRLAPRDIELDWNLGASTLYDQTFSSAGRARIAGSRVTQADGELRLGANRLSARGAYGAPGDRLEVVLDAPKLEQFAPLAGRLRARGTLSGSLEHPRASLSAEADELTLPGGVELKKARAKVDGTLAAHEAQVAVSAPELELEIDARLRGGWREARGWSGEFLSFRNSGSYPLELTSPAPLRVAPGRVELGRFEARLAEGRVLVRDAAWSPALLASSGEFSRLPAQWLIVAAGLGERLRATLLLDGEWKVAKSKEIQGYVRARRAAGDLAVLAEQAIDLGIEKATLEARMEGDKASAQAELATRIGRLTLQGELLPKLALQAKIDFAELGTLTRPFLEEARLDGRLSAELRASGTLASPLLHGTFAGEALAFELPQYGVALRDGSLKAVLEGNTLAIESLALRGGEGSLVLSGTLPLGPDRGARVVWRAEKLGVLERPDMRLVASGEGEVSWDGARVSLTGDVRADRGHFEVAQERLPRLGDDVVVLGDSELQRERKPMTTLPVNLDLRLDLGDDLVVQAYGYDGKVTGLIDLATNKEGELRAYGRVRAVNATFLAYGQRLEVDPGVLIFDGPIDNPSLQITAWRRNQAVEAGVQITGTARAPSVNLVSQPPVPEGERLSWLVLGRPPSGATQADLGMLQAAAGALLAGDSSVPLDRRIARRFGLDELSLRGGSELNDRVVAVGKRLSDRLYVSYEQGLGAVATNLIKLDYALGQRWTLRAETGSTSGGGLYYRYSWD